MTPISAFFSRKNEYEADKFSKDQTNNANFLITALIKLNADNLSNLYPAKAYVWFYYSHPPLFKRIKYLKSLDDFFAKKNGVPFAGKS